jgi:Leucine-rich repeat (LRR) protein
MRESDAINLHDIGLEDETRHNQLPNVDEIRSAYTHPRKSCKKRYVLGAAALLLLVIVVSILASSVVTSKQQDTTGTNDHLQQILAFLGDFSEPGLLENSESAQFKAASWMAVVDTKKVPTHDDRFLQRYALMVLYFATGGHKWLVNLDFANTEVDECAWNRSLRQANGGSSTFGVGCDNEKQVTSVFMNSMGLVGTLPPELTLLTKLQELSLDSNSLSGVVPNLDKVKELKLLSLNSNNYSSKLPKWLGNLPNLVTLRLSSNNFKHAIPTEFQKITSLKNFDADNNVLSGSLNVLGEMKWIENLNLCNNHFTGTIANDFLVHLSGLQILNLSNNLLNGKIPQGLLQLTSLKVLALDNNSLSGIIPTDVTYSSSLQVLSFKENRVTGSIPSSFQSLVNLQRLDASSNEIHGYIPTTLGSLSKLTYLSLSDNWFIASEIPSFLRSMPLLRYLSLRRTGRMGGFPTWLGTDLTELVFLDLDDNLLTGSLPTEIAFLRRLEVLFLSRNDLTGTLPTGIPELSSLSKTQPCCLLDAVLLRNNGLTFVFQPHSLCKIILFRAARTISA